MIPLLLLLAGCAPTPKAGPVYFEVDKATAGTIRGTIRIEGKMPAAKVISLDAEWAQWSSAECAKSAFN